MKISARTFEISPLDDSHNRAGFSCGSAELDRYFERLVSQDIRRRITACFIAINRITSEIAGYYTLSATGVAMDALPQEIVKKLPRYSAIPAVLLGRLAVARSYQGISLGSVLLADALKRSARSEMGVFAMIVDAKDEPARRFYERYGFTLLAGESRRLFLPIGAVLRKLAQH